MSKVKIVVQTKNPDNSITHIEGDVHKEHSDSIIELVRMMIRYRESGETLEQQINKLTKS